MRIHPESPFVQITSAIFDAVIVTALFFLCCIPVITVGAAASAMHTVMMSIALGDSKGSLRPFFEAFRKNLATSTLVWLLALLTGAIVAADIFICFGFQMEQTMILSVMQGLTIGCSTLYFAVASYVFAGISQYHVTWHQAIRNALLWTFQKPLHTFALLAVNTAMTLCCFVAWLWAFPAVVALLYLQAMVLNSAFGFKKFPAPVSIGGEEEIYYD